jgi:hypothetical protein
LEIEVIPFTLTRRTPFRLATLRASAPEGHPQDSALSALADAGLAPVLLHSTSWRHEGGRVVLTYAAVVGVSRAEHPLRPVWRIPLARGTALTAPAVIEDDQVAAHALVHLAWLAGHDRAVAQALTEEWHDALAAYVAAEPAAEIAV